MYDVLGEVLLQPGCNKGSARLKHLAKLVVAQLNLSQHSNDV